jgi:hypothetical protein
MKKSVMSRHRKRVWFGLLGRYLVLVIVLGLIATSVYAVVDADDRPAVVRLAVAAFVAVVLIHAYNHMRQQLEGLQQSAFDEARRRRPAEIRIARTVVRLKESVQLGVASPRYFKESLWPTLVRLSEERGRRGLLQEPHGRRWPRRGPSLPMIADLVRRIGDQR